MKFTKLLALVLALLMVVGTLSLVACGGDKPDDGKKDDPAVDPVDPKDDEKDDDKEPEHTPVNVPVADIEAAVAALFGEGYVCQVDVEDPVGFMDLDAAQIEDAIGKDPTVSAFMRDNVYIFKCKTGYEQTVVDALNAFYARKAGYKSYSGTEQVVKLENARLYSVDGYVMLFITTNHEFPEDKIGDEEYIAEAGIKDYEAIDNVIKGIFGVIPENLLVITEDAGEGAGDGDGGMGGFFGGLGGFGGLMGSDFDGADGE